MNDHALRRLRQDRHLAELAAFPFNFDLDRADHVEPVRLASGGPLEPIAGDDTGGTYFVCADGAVLYADSEGSAGVVGLSVDEAIELTIGTLGWEDWAGFPPGASADEEADLLAGIAETDADIREMYAPELDAQRAELRAALGFPDRPVTELVRRLHTALLTTEPDHLLLNAEEGVAYERLDPYPRPALWEQVLAPGHADLAAMRSGRAAWDAVVADPVRLLTTLRAAQYDRRDTDLPLLRHLLRHQARTCAMSDDLRLAVVLVGLHGRKEDLPLLKEVHETTYDTWCGLAGLPDRADQVRTWAQESDASNHGTDPADEGEGTWLELAREQGRPEVARVHLIRELDVQDRRAYRIASGRTGTSPSSPRLRELMEELTALGDYTQAIRAQRLHLTLQDAEHNAAAARANLERLTELERKAELEQKAGAAR
ncbi:hypothetical protein [Streptomyces sp. NPDC059009]|uniref:hypothetical protein n=1 Tax=Streptomyces sp. NPDC059009 TaxID=3346694 RepID=UPI0036983EA8